MLFEKNYQHGGDVYGAPVRLDFSANINPLGTPQSVKDAVCAAAEDILCYPDPYCRELTATVAAREEVRPDWLLFGAGAAELIFSFCAAVKPKTALITAPTFSEYRTALEAVGAKVAEYALSEQEDFVLDGGILDAIEAKQPKAVILCVPNNPTGRTPKDPALLREVAKLCAARGIWLMVDECFLDLTDGGESYSVRSCLASCKTLVILKAFTKSYGMAGLRLGYCLSANAGLLIKMSRTVQPWNISIPAQKAGVAAMGETEFVLRAMELIRPEREYLTKNLLRLGFRVVPSQTNYILFHADCELKAPLLARGILIRSCEDYSNLGAGWYRIAVKTHAENEILIGELEAVIRG